MPRSHVKRHQTFIGRTLFGVFRKLEAKERHTPVFSNRIRQRLEFDPADFTAIYAVGDVHGCFDKLMEAKARIYEDFAKYSGYALIVMLGDYVDRGTSSKEVIEHLTMPTPTNIKQTILCGNHDDEFSRLLRAPHLFPSWHRFAGLATLKSYGIDAPYLLKNGGGIALERAIIDAVPDHHKKLLEDLPSMLTVGDIVFVHAGIRPRLPLSEQSDNDLLWIREPFLSRGPELPLLVVHGHTAVSQPYFGNGRIGIDTGAFATGNLTVLRITNQEGLVLI